MPSNNGSVTRWLRELRKENGSLAERELFHRYFEKLVNLARNHLGGTKRATEDEEDVALSALDSFFQRAQADQFKKLSNRNDLWAVLVTLVCRKAINQYKRQTALKRGGIDTSEVSLEELATKYPNHRSLVSTEPTPEVLLELQEEYTQRLDRLESEQLREIAELSLQGYTQTEIAGRIHTSERTVRRKLYLIRREWLDATA